MNPLPARSALAAEDPAPRLTSRGVWLLLAGQLLPMLDFSIVNVALPAIGRSLHASPTALELVVALYGVVFAALLALGGRLGDRLGRRRLFAAGVLLFGLASLACGLASTAAVLVGARVLQALAAALLVPQILASLHAGLSGRAHSRALALYGVMGGLAFVAGQVLGGALVAAAGWRVVFLMNLPICAAILAGLRVVPDTRAQAAAPVDVPGTALLGAAVVALLLPLAFLPTHGASGPGLAALGAVPLLLLGLWRVERRAAHPLLPPALLRLAGVRFALLTGGLFFACWGGFMFAMALFLQAGAGMPPAQAGTAFLALGAAFLGASLLAPRCVERWGATGTLVAGALVQMAGVAALIATLRWTWPHPGLAALAPATALMGWGQGLIVNCYLRIGLAQVPAGHAGAGSAMLSTVQQAAMGLGPALLGAVFLPALRRTGSHLDAICLALCAELLVMAALTGRAGLRLAALRRARLRYAGASMGT